MTSPIQQQATQRFYNTSPSGLEPIGHPSGYGLQGYSETTIAYDGSKSLHLWERHIGEDKPTAIMFHGVNGHWGGIAVAASPTCDTSRIEWLGSLPPDVNVIAVSMPGFGKSQGDPSRASFNQANAALVEELLVTRGINPQTLTAKGESMGANHALNFAKQAFHIGKPIAQVDAIVPFTNSHDATVDFLGGTCAGHAMGTLLRHSGHDHDNIAEIEALKGSGTKLMILSAAAEQKVSPPHHQQRLAFAASSVGLCTSHVIEPHAQHKTWHKPNAHAASAALANGSPDAAAARR